MNITARSFEEWVKLYKTNPEQFELDRIEALHQQNKINSENSSSPEEAYQRGLATINNLELKLSKYKGINRYNKMVELFYNQFDKFSDSLNNPPKSKAKVIPFKK